MNNRLHLLLGGKILVFLWVISLSIFLFLDESRGDGHTLAKVVIRVIDVATNNGVGELQ